MRKCLVVVLIQSKYKTKSSSSPYMLLLYEVSSTQERLKARFSELEFQSINETMKTLAAHSNSKRQKLNFLRSSFAMILRASSASHDKRPRLLSWKPVTEFAGKRVPLLWWNKYSPQQSQQAILFPSATRGWIVLSISSVRRFVYENHIE